MVLYLVAQTVKSLSLSQLRNTFYTQVISGNSDGIEMEPMEVQTLLPNQQDSCAHLITKFSESVDNVSPSVAHSMISALKGSIQTSCNKKFQKMSFNQATFKTVLNYFKKQDSTDDPHVQDAALRDALSNSLKSAGAYDTFSSK